MLRTRSPARRGRPDPAERSQHHRLRDRVERVAECDGYSAARPLRLGRLLNTLAASLAVSGTEPREERVARAEHGCPSSSDSAAAIGPAIRIASAASFRDTPASSSPAPTDIPSRRLGAAIGRTIPAIAPTSSPTEGAAANARTAQTSAVLVGIYRFGPRTHVTASIGCLPANRAGSWT